MCETYEGRVDTLNYKTIRYPGHAKLMRFLLYELILKNKRELIEQILTEAKPPVQEDVVYVYAVVEGWKEGQTRPRGILRSLPSHRDRRPALAGHFLDHSGLYCGGSGDGR